MSASQLRCAELKCIWVTVARFITNYAVRSSGAQGAGYSPIDGCASCRVFLTLPTFKDVVQLVHFRAAFKLGDPTTRHSLTSSYLTSGVVYVVKWDKTYAVLA